MPSLKCYPMLLALPLGLLVAGCGSSPAPPVQTPSPPAATAPEAPKPAAKPPATGKGEVPKVKESASKESEAVQAARKLGAATPNPVVTTGSGLQYIDVTQRTSPAPN